MYRAPVVMELGHLKKVLSRDMHTHTARTRDSVCARDRENRLGEM